jgi:UDP-2-acetamido-3-amino-2,3-dideoxy-glucuronate N-acetyltransferase
VSGQLHHPQALVESANVGDGTRVGAFTHVSPGARIGPGCTISDHVFIDDDVVIGEGVNISSGVQLSRGTRIEDGVSVGANVTFTAAPLAGAAQKPGSRPEILVRTAASIGPGVAILGGVTIGQNAVVNAGSVVSSSVPPYAVVVGNPAQIQGYVTAGVEPATASPLAASGSGDPVIAVAGVELTRVRTIEDLRGNLVPRQVGAGLPFTPVRSFVVFDVPSKEIRGEHAHRRCHQLLMCLAGSVVIVCDDGRARQEILLDDRELALHVPPMVWATQYRYTRDAVLLVMASRPYEPEDYIRDYDQFLRERLAGPQT